jgi:hypothetical protein
MTSKLIKTIINSYAKYLSLYIFLLIIGSLNIFVTIIICIFIIFNCMKFHCNKSRKSDLNSYILVTSIGNCITYHIMVESYAEALPWETYLHAIFYLTSYFYFFHYTRQTKESIDHNKTNFYMEKSL